MSNNPIEKQLKNMPDVASDAKVRTGGSLSRVGMSEVEIPVRLRNQLGELMIAPAKGDFYVSLDSENAKGIHMSRLFLIANEILSEKELSFTVIDEILTSFLESHQGLSTRSSVTLNLDYMTKRPALLSNNSGWRFYPISFGGFRKNNINTFDLKIRITYSSTCPCSAALARQIIQERFSQTFANTLLDHNEVKEWLGTEEGISATPHSQRSYADLILRTQSLDFAKDLPALIDTIENSLKTPVQAAVKREDEQEFARLNGENPMFCEDAARRLKEVVESIPDIQDYRIEARHLESLHPHDAVAIVTRGLTNGLQP